MTWGSGTTGVKGAISAANSLVGDEANDQVGSSGVTVLANGNYVVCSPFFNGQHGMANVGPVTWGSGTIGVTGVVSAANSLVGRTESAQVGSSGVTALNNGNYVVSSPLWNGLRGAWTWGSGTTGVIGVVSAANSLVGGTANDQAQVGSTSVAALNNDNYLVSSPYWDNGAVTNVGAVTWGSGTSGVKGTISATNSLVGSLANDRVGFPDVTGLNNGDYVVSSWNWVNGAVTNAGAVTWGNGTTGVTGVVSTANSVLGTAPNGGFSMLAAYDYLKARLFVGYSADNRVSLFGYTPRILVQQPANVNLANDATCIFGAPLGSDSSLTFTVNNLDIGELTGLSITIDGGIDAAMFTVVTNPVSTVGPLGSTAFTVRFTPTAVGWRTANLHLASNDTEENSFLLHLRGRSLDPADDSDGDGLNDAAEFYLSAFGFDWQVGQPNLASTFSANASNAGLFTTNQLRALKVGTPLLAKDPLSGLFRLTIGVQKSTNLADFNPFPMTALQTTINGLGELEFQFSEPDNAAFFRLESK